MERGTDTSRPTAGGNTSEGLPKRALQIGTGTIMRFEKNLELVKIQEKILPNFRE